MASKSRAIVAFREPGLDFLGSRGNVGAMVLDALALRHPSTAWCESVTVPTAEFCRYEDGGETTMLFKPMVPKSRAGEVVAQVIKCFGVPQERVIVVQDDVDYNLGQIRIKSSGGDGGHPGVESTANALGSADFTRLRVGIGRVRGTDRAAFFASPFNPEEMARVFSMIANSAIALDSLLMYGLKPTQKKFHRSGADYSADFAALKEATAEPIRKPIQVTVPEKKKVTITPITATPAIVVVPTPTGVKAEKVVFTPATLVKPESYKITRLPTTVIDRRSAFTPSTSLPSKHQESFTEA